MIGSYNCTCREGFVGDGKVCGRDILILSKPSEYKNGKTVIYWKPAMTINLLGNVKQVQCFQGDPNAVTRAACSVTWKNKMHVFGGLGENKKLISHLTGLKLEPIGSLSFDHYDGGCSVIKDEIYLCFSFSTSNKCRRASGPLEVFTEVADSIYNHREVRISASDGKF